MSGSWTSILPSMMPRCNQVHRKKTARLLNSYLKFLWQEMFFLLAELAKEAGNEVISQ